MSTHEPLDDFPRLAEIVRTISDFRSEFREAFSMMVRRDVYQAEMRTHELRIESLNRELQRLEREQEVLSKEIYEEIEKDRRERRAIRNLLLGTGAAAAVSVLLLIIEVVIKG